MSEMIDSGHDVTRAEITELLARYREGVRHLWNTLVAGSELATFDTVARFADVEKLLFDVVVVPQLAARIEEVSDREWRECLRIVPSASEGVPIMIENPREGDRNCYWDHPIKRVRPEEVELKFMQYFDWWDLGTRDYQYYQVEILRLVGHPELEGRRALVEVGHAAAIVDTTSK